MNQQISLIKAAAALAGCLILTVTLRAQPPAPVLEEIPPVITLEDTPVTIPVRLKDPVGKPETLRLEFSPRPRLATATISGSGSERVIHLQPLANTNGFEILNLAAIRSNQVIGQSRFTFQILPVNDPPEISPPPPLQLPGGMTNYVVPVSVWDPDTHPAFLRYPVESSNPALIPAQALQFGWGSLNRPALTLALAPNAAGRSLITLRVSYGEYSASATFLLEVVDPVFQSGPEATGLPMELLDLNGDGLLDFYTYTPGMGSGYRVWLSSAQGLPAVEVPLPEGYRAIAWADFDGDGDLDSVGLGAQGLVVMKTEVTAADQVQFVHPVFVSFSWGAQSGLTGDLDGDGDLDALLFATSGGTRRALRNEGPAGFTTNLTSNLPRLSASVLPCALADCDLDGDLDLLQLEGALISGTNPRPAVLYANDGLGNFTLLAQSPALTNALAAGLLDLDGHGLPEIWVQTGPEPSSASGPVTLWIYRRSGNQLLLTS